MSALWGKLACDILTGSWDAALDELMRIREMIDQRVRLGFGILFGWYDKNKLTNKCYQKGNCIAPAPAAAAHMAHSLVVVCVFQSPQGT